PARSVYKLEEIDRRCRILGPGMKVLDLGASPGSWTLYAAGKVGASGEVLGLDLKPHRGALPPQARFEVRDVTAVKPDELGGIVWDVVLSDMAPSTTGHRGTDMARSFQLFMDALALARVVLRPGGSFVGKIFQGQDFPEAQSAMRAAFENVRVIRPEATRDVSYEVFLVGTGRRAEP
ncbi:MAG: RlmE family RNA methyltransferase, partial [Polyangiaceae bacterium]|nr:RlmE family RNA methyltransferase [Polyangiaceae bacterium]